LLAAFFVPLAFFVALLRAFFAAGAAALLVLDGAHEAGAAAVDDAGAGLAALDFEALPLDFDAPPAALFFGDARFFGLVALPAAFGLAVPAFLAFFAPVDAFFLLAVAAGAGAGEAAVAAGAVVGVLVAGAAVAGFFDAFFGEAERFRLVPAADFGLLDERAVFGLAPPAAFDRLRDLVDEDFFVADVFLPADEPLAFFIDDFFFAPAREAGLARLAVA